MTTTVKVLGVKVPGALVAAVAINTGWVNASEIFRYFVFIRDLMRNAFPQLPDVVPMNLPVFLSWGVWDMIVVLAVSGFTWLYLDRLGGGARNAAQAGTLAWLAIFVVLWLGLFNMNLATPGAVLTALPLAWLEMVIAALIVDTCRERF